MSYSVIIPSKTASNLIKCVAAVREHEPETRIIVVDDGVDWSQFWTAPETRAGIFGRCNSMSELHHKEHCDHYHHSIMGRIPEPEWTASPPLTIVKGAKPFIFARNCNLGIQSCGDDDVVLLNDDATLRTRGGFRWLQEATIDLSQYGLISAVTNVVGNPAQRPQNRGLREEPRTVAFVCVYIPRRTIDYVGLLDERFTAYGWEDNDFCRRVREAGLKLGIGDRCYVDHGSLRSTFRGLPTGGGNIEAGRAIYQAKWGDAR